MMALLSPSRDLTEKGAQYGLGLKQVGDLALESMVALAPATLESLVSGHQSTDGREMYSVEAPRPILPSTEQLKSYAEIDFRKQAVELIQQMLEVGRLLTALADYIKDDTNIAQDYPNLAQVVKLKPVIQELAGNYDQLAQGALSALGINMASLGHESASQDYDESALE